MKLWCKYFFAAVIFLLIFTGLMVGQSSPTITKVEAVNGYIRIEWEMKNSEVGVDHYEIWRSSGSSIPLCIGTVQRGVFCFDDKTISLYKTDDQYFSYQVKAIGSNSTLQANSEPVGIRYAGTNDAYKRTWGSIKAMFR